MGRYLFQNGNVYFSLNKNSGCMTFEEFLASPMPMDPEAHVLVIETAHGRMGNAQTEFIRRISHSFSRGKIKTFVPYNLALRAFVLERGLVESTDPMIVVDNIGDRYLLSAYNTREAVETRVLLPQNAQRIVEEVLRTRKNLMEGVGLGQGKDVCRFLSNDPEVIEALGGEDKGYAVYFETLFPAFQVLGKTRFAVHLMPPEDIAAHRRQEDLWVLARTGGVALLMVLSGAGYYVTGIRPEEFVDQKIRIEAEKRSVLEDELTKVSADTYQARLKGLPHADFMDTLRQFMEGVPPDAWIRTLSFERDAAEKWSFTGSIVFKEKRIFPFSAKGIFNGADVASVFIDDNPGLRIHAALCSPAAAERNL